MNKLKSVNNVNIFVYLIVVLASSSVVRTEPPVEYALQQQDEGQTHVNTVEATSVLPDNTTIRNETVQTANDTNGSSQNDQQAKSPAVNCLLKLGAPLVQIVNDTELMKLLQSNPNISTAETAALCMGVLFYSKTCPFSSLAAPHFNALPRAFPDIKMIAINAITYHLFNAQNGIVGVPTLLLLHNGKIVDKFNESDYTLDQFARFITKNTGIAAEERSYVTSADFAGPVFAAPNKETDTILIGAWCFICFCCLFLFAKTKWWRWIVESVQHNWRESEAQLQHMHVD